MNKVYYFEQQPGTRCKTIPTRRPGGCLTWSPTLRI